MSTTRFGFPNGKGSGSVLASAEVNTLGNGAEAALLALAEFIGNGILNATDFNIATNVALAVQVSAGTAIIGVSGSRKVVSQAGTVTLTTADGLVASKDNYGFLKSDGTYQI